MSQTSVASRARAGAAKPVRRATQVRDGHVLSQRECGVMFANSPRTETQMVRSYGLALQRRFLQLLAYTWLRETRVHQSRYATAPFPAA